MSMMPRSANKSSGFVTLAGFTCFYCLPGESPATRFQCLSGSNLTFESLLGFPRFAACASLRDARRKIHHRFVGRSASA